MSRHAGGRAFIPINVFVWLILAGLARMRFLFWFSIFWLAGWKSSAESHRHYGRGTSSCLQMARTVPSLISRWRGTLAILCNTGLNQMLWAALSRYKTQPWSRRWRSNSASFMLPRFRKPHARHVGKGLFPQARAGTAAPALARPQDLLWPLRWSRLAKSRRETLPQNKYSRPLWRVQKRQSISCL